MSAEDAVRAHREVGARRMFPVHWGHSTSRFTTGTNRSGVPSRLRARRAPTCSLRGSARSSMPTSRFPRALGGKPCD